MTLAAIEDYAYGVNRAKTNCIFQLGEVGGLVRVQLRRAKVPFIAVPITMNKKFATGNGHADKEQVAGGMARLWSMSIQQFATFDASDALSLATIAACTHYGDPEEFGFDTFRFQRRIVQELSCKQE